MYPNGEWPLSMFEHLGGQHWAPPGTAARWRALVADVQESEGVVLVITPGWNVYRPLGIQRECRIELGIMAAEPGKSSHGMVYLGRAFCAIDVYNWAALGWAKFKHYAEKHGFWVNFVTPTEFWHIGDPAPLTIPAPANVGPAEPVIDYALLRRQKEGDMYLRGTSFGNVYATFTDANGKPGLRVCEAGEAAFAQAGGLVIQGDDSTLMMLAKEAGYGRDIIPNVAGGGLRLIVKKAAEITTTYALYGPGYWDETTDPDLANGWARVYGNAENVTYDEWDRRKAIAASPGAQPDRSGA